MPKRFYSLKYKALTVCLHVLTLILVAVILALGMGRSILMVRNYQNVVFVNPFEAKQSYEETDAFQSTFLSDANYLIKYLAVCKQFETDGIFDPEKEIDLLEYYFRKNPSLKDISSLGVLEYRVQDLIVWKDSYGFTVYDEEELEEIALPTDGVSIYKKQEDILPLMQMCKEIMSQLDSGYEHPYATEFDYGVQERLHIESGVEEVYEEAATDYDETSYAYEDEEGAYAQEYDVTFVVEEDGKAVTDAQTDAKALQKETNTVSVGSEISYEEAYAVLTEILISVSSDLSYNYSVYQDEKDYFTNQMSNFKYLYITGEKEFYTNLGNVTSENVAEYAIKFEENSKHMPAYVCIDATSGNVENKTIDVSASQFLYNLNQIKYAFQDGGKIYLGVIEDGIQDFAAYSEDDIYSGIKEGHEYFNAYFDYFVAGIFILLIISVCFFVLFTILCGRKKDSEEISYNTFDKWYTEIAAAAGVMVAGLLILASSILLESLVLDTSEVFVYHFIHDYYLLYLLIAIVCVCDLFFLFFYGSLVRRIKAGRLVKDSLVYRLFGLIKRAGKFVARGIVAVYHNSNAFIKTIFWFLPCAFILLIHFMAGLFESVVFLFFAFFLDLLAFALLLYMNVIRNKILKGVERISSGELEYQVDTLYFYGDNLKLANAVNHIGDGIREAVNQSMKDERMKADLITNVSHDIKTPLTSIINYVDLLKRENVEDETIRGYIEVLDNKSQRLKQLTEDLVEASKISSGNIVLNIEELNVVDLMKQALGEFVDKFEEKELKLVLDFSETACLIEADSRRMWRVIDNLLGNIYKYALEKTRVYIEVKDLSAKGKKASISIKNISKQALNIEADELTERFIRGDISRSTEGSGLGLSIAKSLVEAQGGTFKLYLDGDLFKVTIVF